MKVQAFNNGLGNYQYQRQAFQMNLFANKHVMNLISTNFTKEQLGIEMPLIKALVTKNGKEIGAEIQQAEDSTFVIIAGAEGQTTAIGCRSITDVFDRLNGLKKTLDAIIESQEKKDILKGFIQVL